MSPGGKGTGVGSGRAKFDAILRTKPVADSALSLEAVPGDDWIIKAPRGLNKTGKPKEWKIRHVVEGETQELYEILRDKVKAATQGLKLVVFVHGSTASGKTYTLEGTKKPPTKTGLVEMIFNDILNGSVELAGEFIEASISGIKNLAEPTVFTNLKQAITWYDRGCASRQTALRRGKEGKSSRSWSSLRCSASNGGELYVFDVPGMEDVGAADSRYINDRYKYLSDGLKAIVKASALGRQMTSRPCTVDAVKRTIDAMLDSVQKSDHTVSIGCVDPTFGTDAWRAGTTLDMLSSLAQTHLPPVPRRPADRLAMDRNDLINNSPQPDVVPEGWVKVPMAGPESARMHQLLMEMGTQMLSGETPRMDPKVVLESAEEAAVHLRSTTKKLIEMMAEFQSQLEQVQRAEWHGINDRIKILMTLVIDETEQMEMSGRLEELYAKCHDRIMRVQPRIEALYARLYKALPSEADALKDLFLKSALRSLGEKMIEADNRILLFIEATRAGIAAKSARREHAVLQSELERTREKLVEMQGKFAAEVGKNKTLMGQLAAIKAMPAESQAPIAGQKAPMSWLRSELIRLSAPRRPKSDFAGRTPLGELFPNKQL